MLITPFWHSSRSRTIARNAAGDDLAAGLRRWAWSQPSHGSLSEIDRHTLADIGIGPGAIVSLGLKVSLDDLRRPPHV